MSSRACASCIRKSAAGADGRVAFDNRILGLRLGADHYLTKPIKFPELAAHIEALDRRVGPQETVPEPGKWTLSARQLELKGTIIT
jgi:DNA-binding response OmpR family regulator